MTMATGPNILLITTDQQRHDTTGPTAPTFLRTPHLDILGREGIRFSAAYAECPICVPARVSIMTGKSVFSHRVAENSSTAPAMGRDDTLPSGLRAMGYQTAAIGKMHFTPERARHGFDEMILPTDYYREMARKGYQPQPMRHGLGQNELYPGMATVPEGLTLTSWIAEQCVDYVRERRDPTVPFFLWCSFSKPHPPLDPPEPYYSMYRESPIPDPVYGDWSENDLRCPEAFKRLREAWSLDLIPPDVIREARAAYYGLVTQVDYSMGRIFAALQDLDLFDDTLILFTSDHGEYLGDHHTGSKTFFHEPSAHVPLTLRLPKNWADRRHGAAIGAPVTHADILPTVVTAAGGEPSSEVDGQDLIALARGELAEPREYVEGMATSRGVLQYLAITDGHWKYIWYPEGGLEQLFDLDSDPHELTDLAGSTANQTRLTELRDEMISLHEKRGSHWVRDRVLPGRPPQGDTVADRRNQSWPGFHTEHYHIDVRH